MHETEQENADVYGFDKKDFADEAQKAKLDLRSIKESLKKLLDTNRSCEEVSKCQPSIPEILILCACHLEPAVWTSKSSINVAKEVLQLLLSVGNCSSPSDLLQGSQDHPVAIFQKGIFYDVLKHLAPQLKTDTWKNNYNKKQGFAWCLFQVKTPYLSEYLDWVVFPPLVFLDDHIVDNKVLGVRCLAHIIDNVAADKLRRNGVAELMYNALEHQLYLHEELLINVLHPCLLSILSVLETSPSLADQPRKFCLYDKVFEHILFDMEMAVQLVQRRALSRHLHLYILRMDITVVRYFKRLLRVLRGYLEVSDAPVEEARLNALQSLKTLIQITWPRIPYHSSEILKIMLKFLHEITDEEYNIAKTVKENLLSEAKECLRLLKVASGEEFQAVLHNLSDLDAEDHQLETITQLLNNLDIS